MNSLKLLVLEPDVAEARRIEERLTPAGHDVCLASDENEAVEVLLVQQFDAVILGPSQTAAAVASFRIQLEELTQLQRNWTSPALLGVAGSAPDIDLPAEAILGLDFEAARLAETLGRLAAAIPVSDATASPATPVTFNPAGFEDQCSGERELMVEIIDLFAAECGRQGPEMAAALAAGAFERLSRLAHTIKGSLGSLHAPLAWQTAQDLERAAHAEDAERCRQLFVSFCEQLDQLRAELETFREACLCAPRP